MEKIIKNIKKNKIKNHKDDLLTSIELELNYKIECEKTKQLQLIKDIRKIEKNIKEKELYTKRKNNINFSKSTEFESDSESDSESDFESDSELELESEYDKNKDNDSISLCSYNSSYSYNEIEIIS